MAKVKPPVLLPNAGAAAGAPKGEAAGAENPKGELEGAPKAGVDAPKPPKAGVEEPPNKGAATGVDAAAGAKLKGLDAGVAAPNAGVLLAVNGLAEDPKEKAMLREG